MRSVEAYRRDVAREHVARLRGDESADTHVEVARRHGFVGSAELRDILGEALDRGRAPAPEVATLAAHAADAARSHALASIRDTLRAHARRRVEDESEGLDFASLVADLRVRPHRGAGSFALVAREAERARGPIEAAVAVADEAAARFDALVAARPDAIDLDDTKKRAEALLASTEDLCAEALDYLAHRVRAPITSANVLAALGAPELDDAFRPDALRERMLMLMTPMGLAEPLVRRVRIEPPHGGAGLEAKLIRVDPPFDIRVSPSSMRGVLGELGLVRGIGRAVSEALAAPALPFVFRHPLEGTVSRAMGELFARITFDRVRIARERRLPAAVQDGTRRLAAIVALMSLRISATGVLNATAGAEQAEAVFASATGVRLGRDMSRLALASRTHGPRLVAGLAALSLHERLREQFDEDFDRNPRTQDAIRGACERGASIAVAVPLADLGGDAPPAPLVAAWFHGR